VRIVLHSVIHASFPAANNQRLSGASSEKSPGRYVASVHSGDAPAEAEGVTRASWFADRSVAVKLTALIVVALLAMIIVGGLGIDSLRMLAGQADDQQNLTALTRVTLEADMAHDAVRGDVQRVLLATAPGEAAQARADLTDHGAILRDGVQRFTRADVSPKVRAAARAVTPAVEHYLSVARVTAEAAGPGRGRPSTMAAFNTAFRAVEVQLPAVGDALGVEVAALSRQAEAARTGTVRQLYVTLVVAAALLALLGRLVTRAITGPLRRVSAVCAALAAGDLTQAAGLRSRDEFGRMAGGLDQAMATFRTAMQQIGGTAGDLTAAAEQLAQVSGALRSGASDASARAESATRAAGQVNDSVQAVRLGVNEIAESVAEIADGAGRAAAVTRDSVDVAARATHEIALLGTASEEIGGVVALITSITEQTNLLALNATIEAARAGDAGKGFAVVAGEVKELAQETARATADITRRIGAIQDSTTSAAAAVERIQGMIGQINESNSAIASAAEEQSAVTGEMTAAISATAGGSAEVLTAVETTARVVGTTSESAGASQVASQDLARHASRLKSLVGGFRY
jgi:methyl-accepting chemotaxis protein